MAAVERCEEVEGVDMVGVGVVSDREKRDGVNCSRDERIGGVGQRTTLRGVCKHKLHSCRTSGSHCFDRMAAVLCERYTWWWNEVVA